MRLSIRHETSYRYDTPVQYSIHQLRLTPPAAPTQFVAHWDLSVPGKLNSSVDAYGNTLHTLVITRPVSELTFVATGDVDTTPLQDGRLLEGPGRIPLEHFTCATSLTTADDAVIALAHAEPQLGTPASLIALSERIRAQLSYRTGVTEVTSTAAEALALGQGVCQDYAHILIACCRARDIPARYVSGYVHAGEVQHGASHAWVDVWLADYGWISVDVTQGAFASGHYCRMAIGRDYPAAAPVRGMRVGGGSEKLAIDVKVNAAQATRSA